MTKRPASKKAAVKKKRVAAAASVKKAAPAKKAAVKKSASKKATAKKVTAKKSPEKEAPVKAAPEPKKKAAAKKKEPEAKIPVKKKRKRANKKDKEAWYPETRKTLIERLDNWEDRASWDEFYRTYANFVFRVGLKAGLTESEANDALQETFIGIAKNLQRKKFDTGIGSFKAWLMNQARWRIIDQFRNRKKDLSAQNPGAPGEKTRRTATLDRYADPKGEPLEKIWDREWRESLLDIALRAVKNKVSPQQYQIFTCYVIKGWPAGKVKDELGVNVAQVYLAKHRVGRILKKELAKLEDKSI